MIAKPFKVRDLRGFEFSDLNGAKGTVQESSLATEYGCWLGCDGHRLLLSTLQAGELASLLMEFATTGQLPCIPKRKKAR